jgi:hypothetical protein
MPARVAEAARRTPAAGVGAGGGSGGRIAHEVRMIRSDARLPRATRAPRISRLAGRESAGRAGPRRAPSAPAFRCGLPDDAGDASTRRRMTNEAPTGPSSHRPTRSRRSPAPGSATGRRSWSTTAATYAARTLVEPSRHRTGFVDPRRGFGAWLASGRGLARRAKPTGLSRRGQCGSASPPATRGPRRLADALFLDPRTPPSSWATGEWRLNYIRRGEPPSPGRPRREPALSRRRGFARLCRQRRCGPAASLLRRHGVGAAKPAFVLA